MGFGDLCRWPERDKVSLGAYFPSGGILSVMDGLIGITCNCTNKILLCSITYDTVESPAASCANMDVGVECPESA